MAQRLATEYVKASLTLTEAEMSKFVQLFAEQQMNLQVKVLENGNQEVVFQDDAVQEFVLSFERQAGCYVFQGSCRLTNPKLANAMRKAVSMFKGDAVVNRIYSTYTMVYHYVMGSAVKIIEIKDGNEKLIYEFKDTIGQLQHLFNKNNIEAEIQVTHIEINELLDLRNTSGSSQRKAQIDEQLKVLTQKLFALEA
jgi:hypothetical protein